MSTRDRIFIGVYPCGLVYADRQRERNGDYARLAFLPYATLQLELESDCPPACARWIRTHAARLKPGDELIVSSAGQTVILGKAVQS